MNASNEIYVVDDDAAVRDAIKLILKSAGYSLVAFSDGDRLLEAARRRQPLCIILDLVIPGKTGMEVLEALKPSKYPAPVLVISGQGTIASAVAVLKAGAFDFIEKPFSKKQLLERVEAAIDIWQPGLTIPVRLNGPSQPLTAREIQILEWLQTGKTSKVIGKALKVSCRTVEYHRGNLMRKFGVNSATRLLQVVLARQNSDQTSHSKVKADSAASRHDDQKALRPELASSSIDLESRTCSPRCIDGVKSSRQSGHRGWARS